jgi:hypothetical protein
MIRTVLVVLSHSALDFDLRSFDKALFGVCGTHQPVVFSSITFFFFLVAMGFELRALQLLGRCFYHLSHSASPVVFSDSQSLGRVHISLMHWRPLALASAPTADRCCWRCHWL